MKDITKDLKRGSNTILLENNKIICLHDETRLDLYIFDSKVDKQTGYINYWLSRNVLEKVITQNEIRRLSCELCGMESSVEGVNTRYVVNNDFYIETFYEAKQK